jgi:membrane protein required for colicin V production
MLRAMNPFDAAVYAVAILAIVMGFNAGLLRSLATILGYLIAAPIALAITPRVTAFALGQTALPPDKTWIVLCCVFVAVGIFVSALLRTAVGEFIGPNISLFDRLAGAVLGAARIGLVAVLIVVIFDRMIPADRQPAFLAGSQLRPLLSAAGQRGLQSLPPDIEDYIDRVKRERGI